MRSGNVKAEGPAIKTRPATLRAPERSLSNEFFATENKWKTCNQRATLGVLQPQGKDMQGPKSRISKDSEGICSKSISHLGTCCRWSCDPLVHRPESESDSEISEVDGGIVLKVPNEHDKDEIVHEFVFCCSHLVAKRFRSLLAAHSCAGIDVATLSVCTEGFSWIFKQALGRHALRSEMIEEDKSGGLRTD